MAGTGGYFLQGLAGGLQTGYNMRMNKMEMDWKKKEREALKKKQDEFIEVSQKVQGMITKFGEDGAYSSDEILQLNTAIMAGGIEIQQQFKDWMKSIQDGDREKVSQQKGYIDSWLNEIDGFTPENIDSVFNSVSQYVTHPEAKKYLDASMAIKKKKAEYADPNVKAWERAGTLPMESRPEYLRAQGIDIPQPTTAPKTPGITDYKGAVDYLSKFINANPETFNAILAGLEKNTGIDLSAITQQSLKTPEKVPATAKAKVQDPNDILFGTNGIMKDYINSGSQLGEEQKAEIRNKYNLIKPSLSADVRVKVEDYLQQIGVDLNAPIPAPTPESTTPEAKQPGLLGKAWNYLKNTTVEDVKNKIQGKGNTPPQQDYAAMSDDELADLALTGDQAVIDELKRRGLL